MKRSRTTAARVVGPAAARRILLGSQGLAAAPAGRAGPGSLRRLIHRLGFVQIDSINVLERAHHLILHSRIEHHRPRNLTLLLERDRALFEHWTHDASVIPIEWYPHWKPRFAAHAARIEQHAWWRNRLGESPEALLSAVHRRVEEDGPLRGRDLDDLRRRDTSGGWWNWHPGKAALEHLWRVGRLAISGRDGFEKRYDLAERVHPESIAGDPPSLEAQVDWACRAALERLGVATPSQVAAFFKSIPVALAREWCRDAGDRGEIEPVLLEDLDGVRRPAYATSTSRRLERIEPWSDEFRLLCPFDPVIRDRGRLAGRFGFEYRFEAFVPAAKRRFGYYVMPILHGDRFVGRFDPKFDRSTATIEIRGLWWEPGFGTRADRRRFESAMNRLSERLGAANWTMDDAGG